MYKKYILFLVIVKITVKTKWNVEKHWETISNVDETRIRLE